MRKILLLTVLIAVYCLPTLAQGSSQVQIDTTRVKFGFPVGSISLGHHDSIDIKQLLSNSEPHKYILNPKSADKNFGFGQLNNGKISLSPSPDHMPCLYPQGSYPMPVYKPDSTINYSLLIKKFK
jgi:hypothetical protein